MSEGQRGLMKRAYKNLMQKKIINSEQHVLPLKSKNLNT